MLSGVFLALTALSLVLPAHASASAPSCAADAHPTATNPSPTKDIPNASPSASADDALHSIATKLTNIFSTPTPTPTVRNFPRSIIAANLDQTQDISGASASGSVVAYPSIASASASASASVAYPSRASASASASVAYPSIASASASASASVALPSIASASSANVAYPSIAANLDPTQDIPADARRGLSEDPKCMKGKPGFESNVWQLTVPVNTWINKTGSFFDSAWYMGPGIISTSGTDNTVGATRTTVFDGTTLLKDTLVGSYRSPTQSVQRFALANGPVSLRSRNLRFYSYTEELRATSICGGTATHYSMTATYCTDDPERAYRFFDAYRREKVGNVAREVGAKMFNGTCPVVRRRSVLGVY
ncbi:hypothetical protein C0995_015651 [Termitomyces sp. Mi166|nr:hypothetical protein C0995_015651 [Termitomyces sp. Mi166\